MKRRIAILGSTGSIGTQALEVITENPDLFEVYALTANNQVDLLISQARQFHPGRRGSNYGGLPQAYQRHTRGGLQEVRGVPGA